MVPGPEDVTLLRDGELRQGVWDAHTRGFRVLLGPYGALPSVTMASEVVAPNVPLLTLQKKYTSVMIRVCHSRSRFLSCMYIHDKFMTESR